jgi:hypothetical protein
MQVLEVAGAAAALVGWVALVGGAREYARFKVAGVPGPLGVAASLPRDQLIGGGVDALAMPLLAAVTLAALAYLAAEHVLPSAGPETQVRRVETAIRDARLAGMNDVADQMQRELARWSLRAVHPLLHDAQEEWEREFRGRREARISRISILLAAGASLAVVAAALLSSAAVTFVAVGLFVLAAAGAIALRNRTARGVAIAGFVLTLGFGGIFEATSYATRSNGRLDRVVVDRRGGRAPVAGFFIARSGGNVDVAVLPQRDSAAVGDSALSLITVPADEIESVVIGAPVRVAHGKVLLPKGAPPPQPVTQPAPPRGPTISHPPTQISRKQTTNTTTTPPSTPPVPPTPAERSHTPRVVLSARDVVADRRGVFVFRLGPQHEAVHLTVRVYAYRRGPHHLLTPVVARQVPAGGRVAIPLRLPRSFRHLLARRGRVATRVAVTVAGPDGVSSTRARLDVRRR